jgi:putative FmdB family regulatory protein
MPLYEYKCKKCKHSFEVLVRKEDAEKAACPAKDEKDEICGGEVDKMVSQGSFILKAGGTGWGP